jgi:transcriptional regulator with XRE-family HTH domain
MIGREPDLLIALPQSGGLCTDLCGFFPGVDLESSEKTELSEEDSRALSARVREELARRRISRRRLADEAKISLSTLEKALNGSRPFTLATIIRLEEALRITLHASARPHVTSGTAPVELGGYTPGAVKWLEGDYLTLRPSFDVKDAIYAYCTNISWNSDTRCLRFQESKRLDSPYSQKGVVSVPNKSAQIYLHTSDEGQFRLAIMGRPLISGEMYGVLTTLRAARGGQLQPVSAPLVLLPITPKPPRFGRIMPDDPIYESYRHHLDRVTSDDHARLILP